MNYIISLIEQGRYKTKSKNLQVVLSEISNEYGNIFNNRVFAKMSNFGSLILQKNLKKINNCHISNLQGDTLGDIDVFAIDVENKSIYVIETKNFFFSQTPYQIRMEYQSLFIDTDKRTSFSTRHKRRTEWVSNNLHHVKEEYKLVEENWNVVGLFVVNNPIISGDIYHKKINILTLDELDLEKLRKLE